LIVNDYEAFTSTATTISGIPYDLLGAKIGVTYDSNAGLVNPDSDIHWIQFIYTNNVGFTNDNNERSFFVDTDTPLPYYDSGYAGNSNGFEDIPSFPDTGSYYTTFTADSFLVQQVDVGPTGPTVAIWGGLEWGFTATNQIELNAPDISVNTPKGQPVTVNVLANTYVPYGVNVSMVTADNGTQGTTIVNGNNSITYTPNSNTWSGYDAFGYTVYAADQQSSGTVFVAVNPPTELSIDAPDDVTAGTPFTITVTAYDSSENTATWYNGTVVLYSTDTVATIPVPITLTNGVGVFTATLRSAGNRIVSVSDSVDSTLNDSATIHVNPGDASHLEIVTAGATGTGAPFAFGITALDDEGNTVTDYNGTIHFTSSDGAATLPANTTLISGIGTFSATLATSGTQTITVTDTNTGSIVGSFNALPATHFGISAAGNATSGAGFGLTVTALDAYNNAATGYNGTLHFSSSDTVAGLPIGGLQLTNGVGTFSAVLLTTSSRTLVVTDTTHTATSGTTSITVGAATLAQFSVTGLSANVAGGTTVFTVTAQDLFYNSVGSGYTGTVHFTSSDSAAVLPSNTALTSGTGVFSATLNTAGGQEIGVSDVTNTSAAGAATVVVNPQIAHFAVVAPGIETAGGPIAFTITAEDSYNGTVTSYTGTVYFSSTDSQAVVPGFCTLTSGVGTFTATLKTAGSQNIVAIDALIGETSAGSAAVTVNPAGINHFVVTAPTAKTAGNALAFTVTAQDAYNNTITGYNGTVQFSSSDGNFWTNLPANHTLTSGTGTFSATLTTAGGQTITASDTTHTTATGHSGTVTVSPAAVNHLYMSASSYNPTAGDTISIYVEAVDPYNNGIVGDNDTITFSSTDGAATLPSNTALVSGYAVVSATLATAGSQSITATSTTHATVTGNTGSITVSPGAAVAYILPGEDGEIVGTYTTFTLSVYAVDAYGNIDTNYNGGATWTGDGSVAGGGGGRGSLPFYDYFVSGVWTDNFMLLADYISGSSITVTGDDSITATITVFGS
jgi:hypothetical protein